MDLPTHLGSTIAGKYRVERVLGQGGMGVVVAARHLFLGERVAIKFPAAPFGDRGLSTRLIQEASATMKIRSEHVARVFDIGTLQTGDPYFVMEYLVGSDLAKVVAKGGPLPIASAVEYVLQAIEALAEAHARGIIHRDLKPSNLFLTHRADGSPLVKVIDFGLSKFQASSSSATSTSSFATPGTPLYMAPEQMESRREIDARCDIWALGATLHSLVTGAPPFAAGSMVEIYKRILHGPPPLRQLLPEAPAILEAAVLRCLQQEPSARFATVADLAEALAELAPSYARVSVERAARTLRARSFEGPAEQGPGAERIDPLANTDGAAEASWANDALEGNTRAHTLPDDTRAETAGDATQSLAGSSRPRKGIAQRPRGSVSSAALVGALLSLLVVAIFPSALSPAARSEAPASKTASAIVGAPSSAAGVQTGAAPEPPSSASSVVSPNQQPPTHDEHMGNAFDVSDRSAHGITTSPRQPSVTGVPRRNDGRTLPTSGGKPRAVRAHRRDPLADPE